MLPDRKPHSRLVGPKIALMEKRISELDTVVTKLVRYELANLFSLLMTPSF